MLEPSKICLYVNFILKDRMEISFPVCCGQTQLSLDLGGRDPM